MAKSGPAKRLRDESTWLYSTKFVTDASRYMVKQIKTLRNRKRLD